jgi:hypothetical protein
LAEDSANGPRTFYSAFTVLFAFRASSPRSRRASRHGDADLDGPATAGALRQDLAGKRLVFTSER